MLRTCDDRLDLLGTYFVTAVPFIGNWGPHSGGVLLLLGFGLELLCMKYDGWSEGRVCH